MAVLRRAPDGTVTEVVEAPFNARSAVHEYGGGAWWVVGGVLWFVDWASQRLHRVEPGGAPVPITPEPAVPRGLRFADGDLSPDGTTLLCVQEEHHADGSEATNTIVRLAAHEPSTPDVVVEGPDFVAHPRWRPDGGAFCWLEWDHPDMPWDATRLVVDEGGGRTVVAGGEARESVGQPTWAPDGSLWFFGDRTGFWSLYRWTPAGGVEPMVDLGLDIGFPRLGVRAVVLRVPRRRTPRVQLQRRRARAPGRAGARLRSGDPARRTPLPDRPAPCARERGGVHRGQPDERGARRGGRRRHGRGRRRRAPA